MQATSTWTCQAPSPVTLAESLVLHGSGGGDVHLARGRSTTGACVWRCTGGHRPPFAIEARDDARGALVTRPEGVPFGRLVVAGRLLPRLELHDHDHRRARIRRDGRVVDAARRTIARLRRDGDDVVLELRTPVDDTLWALLVAGLLHLPADARPSARTWGSGTG